MARILRIRPDQSRGMVQQIAAVAYLRLSCLVPLADTEQRRNGFDLLGDLACRHGVAAPISPARLPSCQPGMPARATRLGAILPTSG